MKENNTVVLVDPCTLIPNETKLSIYQEPENYKSIKENIRKLGIIEPLIVNDKTKVIISGNLRYQVALELGLDEVPVIFKKIKERDMDITSISTNQVRVKSFSEVLKAMKFFDDKYKVKKGQRTDLNPDYKKIKEERDEMLAGIPKDTQNKLRSIDTMASILYGANTKEYKKIFKELDIHKTTLNGVWQHLVDSMNRKRNEEVIPETYEVVTENVQIYNTSSSNMFQVNSETVNSIITSPPYFQMKDYGTGETQMGQESSVEIYLNNLMTVFQECYRVLKDDGSLFVNINDCVIDGKYQAVPQKFVIKMLELGWFLNDEMLWIKNNPTYTRGKRSVRSHEPIYHFVKSENFYYNDDWLKNLEDIDNEISYGTNNTNPKVISGLDFRDGVLRTNVSSTAELRKKCAEKGFHLTHSATFPIDVPTICALLSTKQEDTILDCFTGTSTVGLFARTNNRKFIGYELNPEYIMASEISIRSGGGLFLHPDLYKRHISPKEKIQTTGKLKSQFSNFSKIFNSCMEIVEKY